MCWGLLGGGSGLFGGVLPKPIKGFVQRSQELSGTVWQGILKIKNLGRFALATWRGGDELVERCGDERFDKNSLAPWVGGRRPPV